MFGNTGSKMTCTKCGGTKFRGIGSAVNATAVIKSGCSAGFQILCHNCNYAKSRGLCPHKVK